MQVENVGLNTNFILHETLLMQKKTMWHLVTIDAMNRGVVLLPIIYKAPCGMKFVLKRTSFSYIEIFMCTNYVILIKA